MQVHGQRVVITGATGGLGPSLVEAFLALGASVIAVGRRRTALDDLRASMAHHDRLEVAECDVSDPQGTERLFDSLERGGGPVDTVVHAAGAFVYGPLTERADTEVDQLVRGNVQTTAVVLRAAMRRMTPRCDGRIVLLAADRARTPDAGFVLYGGAKAAVSHMAEAAAEEGRPAGVRVNALLPGVMNTPANREAMPDADPSQWAGPRAVAATAAWLAGDDAAGVNGALIRLPGG